MTKIAFPILRLAVFALLVFTPSAAKAEPETFYPCCTGNGCHICIGWASGWGGATFSQAVQPGTNTPCDPNHQCQLTLQGTVTAQTFFGAAGEIGEAQPTVVTETLDFPHPLPNGSGGSCYPAVGNLAITDSTDPNSTLVIAFQGQGCQSGMDQTQVLVIGTYILDSASTGRFLGTAGIGSLNFLSPTGLSRNTSTTQLFPYALTGNLRFIGPGQQPGATAAAAACRPRSFLSAMAVPASGLGSVGLGLFAFVWTLRRPKRSVSRLAV